MLTKRVALVTSDRLFQRRAISGLMAAGASVDIYASVEELLRAKAQRHMVIHDVSQDTARGRRDFERLLAGLDGEVPVVAVLPKPDLELMVALMMHEACRNVLVAEEATPPVLAGVVSRHLHGDIFGLEKHLPWGVRVYSMLVGDYQEKSVAIATVSEYAAALGVRRKYLENIERVVDELLMNALYDAPVDESGQAVFAEVSARDRLSVRLEQKALIQYACDGERFAVAVRDHYGTLAKQVVLKYLDKCLHSEEQIDRKEGGAGLGLYIVANSVTRLAVNLHPSVATEVVCLFDLSAPKVVLKDFGVYEERIEAAGRLVAATDKKLAVAASRAPVRASTVPMPTSLKVILGSAVLLLLAAAAVLIWTQFRKPAAGALVVRTKPPGASVLVDGASRGTAGPQGLRVEDLRADRPHLVRVELEGYEPAERLVRVNEGQETVQVFQLKPLQARVLVQSKPPGARVFLDGKDTGKLTPTVLRVPPRKKLRIRVAMEDYEAVEREITSPPPGKSLELPLVELKPSMDWATVRVLSNPVGARVFVNGVMQRGRTPLENLAIPAGRPIELELRLKGYVPWKTTVQLQAQTSTTVRANLAPAGYLSVSTNLGACQLVVGKSLRFKLPVQDAPIPVGRHKALVTCRRPYARASFQVTLGKDQHVSRRLLFGFVKAGGQGLVLRLDGRRLKRVGLLPGGRVVTLEDPSTGKTYRVRVQVRAGKTAVAQPQ